MSKKGIWLMVKIIVLTVVLLVSSTVFTVWYFKTNGIRKYENQVYQKRLYAENQELDIKILTQAGELTKLQREARRIKPSYQSENVSE